MVNHASSAAAAATASSAMAAPQVSGPQQGEGGARHNHPGVILESENKDISFHLVEKHPSGITKHSVLLLKPWQRSAVQYSPLQCSAMQCSARQSDGRCVYCACAAADQLSWPPVQGPSCSTWTN
jgi:hypothetical protein